MQIEPIDLLIIQVYQIDRLHPSISIMCVTTLQVTSPHRLNKVQKWSAVDNLHELLCVGIIQILVLLLDEGLVN